MHDLMAYLLVVLTTAAAIGMLFEASSHGVIDSMFTTTSRSHAWFGAHGRHSATSMDVWKHTTGLDANAIALASRLGGLVAALAACGLQVWWPSPFFGPMEPPETWQYAILGCLFLFCYYSGMGAANVLCVEREPRWVFRALVFTAALAGIPAFLALAYRWPMPRAGFLVVFGLCAAVLVASVVVPCLRPIRRVGFALVMVLRGRGNERDPYQNDPPVAREVGVMVVPVAIFLACGAAVILNV